MLVIDLGYTLDEARDMKRVAEEKLDEHTATHDREFRGAGFRRASCCAECDRRWRAYENADFKVSEAEEMERRAKGAFYHPGHGGYITLPDGLR